VSRRRTSRYHQVDAFLPRAGELASCTANFHLQMELTMKWKHIAVAAAAAANRSGDDEGHASNSVKARWRRVSTFWRRRQRTQSRNDGQP
jgi:hypothetical protein